MSVVQAAFALHSTSSDALHQISFASGSKCLPTDALPQNGTAIHDAHAEVLARRGALRWFIHEINRLIHGHPSPSPWFTRHPTRHHYFTLAPSISVLLCISTVPCKYPHPLGPTIQYSRSTGGDASISLLAHAQDPVIKKLKDSHLDQQALPLRARGRDNYSLYSVLRTKPGRADSPPTSSLSCSDKIARWAVLGFQGALLSRILEPVYIDQIIIDERNIPEHIRHTVRVDCQRAFGARIAPLVKRAPRVTFEKWPFEPPMTCPASPHEALSWTAADPSVWDITVRGCKRGVPTRQRSLPRFLPLLCKQSLFRLWIDLTRDIFPEEGNCTYYEAKQLASSYNDLKATLMGPGCPFEGWLVSGKPYEDFNVNQ